MKEEFCRLQDELTRFARISADEVSKINDKGDLTPSEVDSVYKIANIMEKSTKAAKMLGLMEDDGYSQYYPDMPYEPYNNMAGNSYTRGRSMTTGRYMSRSNGPGRYEGGHSGHSVNDRMIMALEQEMNFANSEYDRKQIQDQINRIRSGN